MTSASTLGSAHPSASTPICQNCRMPPLLGPLVAEHRPGVVELRATGPFGTRLCSSAARTTLAVPSGRSVRERRVALVLERVHLLGDDVGRLADAAREDLGVLEERRVDRLVAVAREELLRGARQVLPRARGPGEHVGGAFGGACVQGDSVVH